MANKIGIKSLAGYGQGDFGINLFWQGLAVYLLFYYTEVLKIDAATAGFIFSICILWDAVTDPVMGYIATRTRTRWGKFKPYVLFGAPFMGLSFVMMFAAPILFPNAIFAACIISHLIFRTLFTVVSTPYSSLSSVMTRDSEKRSLLSGARMFGAVSGTFIVTLFMKDVAEQIGGDNLQYGWAMVAGIFAIITTLTMVIVFLTTEEKVTEAELAQKVSFADTVRFIKSNTALWILLVVVVLHLISLAMAGKSMLYFIKYNLDADAEIGRLLGLQSLAAALSVPFWVWVSSRTSKRTTWMVATALLLIVQLWLYAFTPTRADAVLPYLILIGISLGAAAVMFWSTVPDTVEYGQWKSGVRDEGITFSITTFSQKCGAALGVSMLGFYLGSLGYQADAEQTPTALAGIETATFLFPALINVAVLIGLWFYPIDRHHHAQMLKDIEAGSLAT